MSDLKLCRMRTVRQCYEYFHKEDEDSCISEYYLRTLVKQNKVPVFKSGAKFLINLDSLILYLSREETTEEPVKAEYGTLRKLTE